MPIDPLDSIHITKNFPDHVLLDIARNGSAQQDYRLLAVEILNARKSPKLQHPDIQFLVRDLEIELEGIVFEHPAPSGPGPLTAGVTTATMFADVPIQNEFTGFESIDMDSLREDGILVDAVTTEVISDIPPTEPEAVSTKPKRNPKPPKDKPDAAE
jgi:hypothetical protein